MRWMILFLSVISCSLMAQSDFLYQDAVYLPHIKSIKFHHQGLFTSEPIIDLNSGGQLELSFDDVLGGDIPYTYKIVHCDKDWNLSDLNDTEYIDGFNDERVERWYYSSGTRLDYTHYKLSLPNDDINWLISGNYLLIVTDKDADVVAFTRRFMVVEPKVSVAAEVRRPIPTSLIGTHQQIRFNINNKNFDIINPQREIYVTILQNGRWDNAITGIQPRFVNGFDINFDFTDQLIFPGGKEFRFADVRSLRYAGPGVHSIERRVDGFDVLMNLDKSRQNRTYFDYNDLDGDFIIETLDRADPDLESEYVNVHFGLLDNNPPINGDVYVVGKFSDWRCQNEYKMSYNVKNQGYYGKALLKQGYYDYEYVVKDGDNVDYDFYEGSLFKTTNDYLILVYYRAFSERYDRLIAAYSLRSDF